MSAGSSEWFPEGFPEVGGALPTQSYRVTRADLVRYAGASGDFNPIHWSDRVAKSVGLPGVVAHGMFTMALAARALDTWVGGPGKVKELGCKFTKPVLVPDDDDGVELVVNGTIREVTDEAVHILLDASCDGVKVLGSPKAVLAR